MTNYAINAEDIITPLQSGRVLLEDIEAARPTHGQAAIWWLGQSGYAIKTESTLLCMDLYLSEHLTHKYAGTAKPHVRMTHAPVLGDDLRNIDWVFSSHKHGDHLDPGTLPGLFTNNPDARLVLPMAAVELAESIGLDKSRLIPTRGDESIKIGNMEVYSVPSAHEALDHDSRTGYPYLGYVIAVDGVTLYHSGDTVVYDGLADKLRQFELDIAFLPINGTDDRRRDLKVPPNMDIEDAVDLAVQIGRPLVIPNHYDMFTFNTADVSEFMKAAEHARQPYRVLKCGERFVYQRQ